MNTIRCFGSAIMLIALCSALARAENASSRTTQAQQAFEQTKARLNAQLQNDQFVVGDLQQMVEDGKKFVALAAESCAVVRKVSERALAVDARCAEQLSLAHALTSAFDTAFLRTDALTSTLSDLQRRGLENREEKNEGDAQVTAAQNTLAQYKKKKK